MELTEDLIEEILFRVPPDEPAYLVRAALVCRSWRRILSDRGFLHRYRVFHRTPPLLGYLHNLYFQGPIPRFVRTSAASPFTPPSLGSKFWRALDCRHGRVLARTLKPDDRLVVWDPMTGDQQHLSVPTYPRGQCYTGAVLCAVDEEGCNHLGCHGGRFVVVFMVADVDHVVRASMYSSENHAWGTPSSAVHVDHFFDDRPSLLAGGALHFALVGGKSIVKYNLVGHQLSVIDTPGDFEDMVMTKAKDGGLGFVTVLDRCIYLWTQQQAGANGARTGWAKHKAMELKTLFPKGYRSKSRELIGLAEGTDTIFINRAAGIFALDLKSKQVKMVGERGAYNTIFPYMSFYTPDLAKDRPSPP